MDAKIRLYSKLSQLPLFLGMSRDEMDQVVGQTKFNFRKVEAGTTFIHEGEACGQFVFLVDGTAEATTFADDRSYSVLEQTSAPTMLQPERAFGVNQRFMSTYRAIGQCNLILLDKNETQRLADSSFIFRLNLINLLSTALQKSHRQPWRHCPLPLEERIVRFFAVHCLHPAGQKVFRIKMQTLANELNDNRLHISQCLNALADAGLLRLQRGTIIIPAIERLLQRG